MPNANIVILLGHATRDPEMLYTQNKIPIAKWGIACTRKWKSKDGQAQESTAFVDCVAFHGLAEVVNKYLRKGAAHYVQGYLQLEQWQDKEGNKRSKLSVVVDQFQLCSKPPTGEHAPTAPTQTPKGDNDSDIPF